MCGARPVQIKERKSGGGLGERKGPCGCLGVSGAVRPSPSLGSCEWARGGAAEGVGGRCERGAQGFPAPLLASSCSLGVISGHTPRGLSWARESFYGDTFRSEFLKTQSTATF